MGLFDVFTGDAAKKAAEENSGRLSSLNSLGTDLYGTAYRGAQGNLTSALGEYQPLADLAYQQGKGSQLYLDALGVNGPEGNQRATAAFRPSLSYDFNLDQGLAALSRRRAATGMLNSGNTDADAIRFGSGLASGEINGWMDRLSGLNSNAINASGAVASGKAGVFGNLANLDQLNANNLVGLNKFTTEGLNSQTTQKANAETAASGNLWNFGLNLAKLGTSFAGGMGK